MNSTVPPGEQVDGLMTYCLDFSNWESLTKLYHEARVLRESKYHLLFVQGLSDVFRAYVIREAGNLQVFSLKHRNLQRKPPAPDELHAGALYDHRCAIIGLLDREAKHTNKGPRVSAISCLPTTDY